MKFFLLIAFLLSLLPPVKSRELFQSLKDSSLVQPDTLKVDTAAENKIIDEIVATPNAPREDKVQFISKLTRYGFKNLFTKFNYNPSLSYSSQVNPHAELFMQDYLKGHSRSLEKMKSWGLPYFNLIDNIFAKYGLPKELKYLAVIESNLKTGATSWVGAGGPWQFMPYTAKGLGLVVNRHTDERRDYFKSTHAAARYLLQLYRDLHDWLLVIAAYNGGPGRVYEAIRKSGSRDFWSLQYFLPNESRNHVKKFIATHYVMETGSTAFGKQALVTKQPELTKEEKENAETMKVSGKYNSKVIVKYLSLEMALFERYNPNFDKRIAQAEDYPLTLPSVKMRLFKEYRYRILEESIQLLLDDNGAVSPATGTPKNKKKN